MYKTILVLDDGTEISSGASTVNAIQSVTITQTVNSQTDLNIGSVCASSIDAKIITPGGNLSIAAGDEVTVYRDNQDSRHKIGVFMMEKPTKSSANSYKVLAYDRIVKLDKDLSDWLNSLDAWPYSLKSFAGMVCEQCGLAFASGDFPNSDYQIPQFIGSGITGRKLMSWVGQIASRYVYADPDGNIRLGWYKASAKKISASGSNYILNKGISYDDYSVPAIDKVQIQFTNDDVGTVYPEDASGENVYKITGNYLLTTESAEQLLPVAQNIYNELHGVSYTPCRVSIIYDPDINAGDIVDVTDSNGSEITMYVMEKVTSGMKSTLKCTGNHARTSATAVHDENFGAVNAKFLEIKKDIEGLNVRASDIQTKLDDGIKSVETSIADVSIKADGISSEVSKQQEETDGVKTRLTKVEQDAEQISISVQDIRDNGVDKVSTEFGLTIDGSCVDIHRSGTEMHNSLDETGMYVKRSEDVMLQANANGVIATDVSVRNYLIIGSHARFEDYSDGTDSARTACFWIS